MLTFIKHGNFIPLVVTYEVAHHDSDISLHCADKICLEFDKDAIQELLSVLKTCDTGIQAHAAELLVKLKPQAVKWSKCTCLNLINLGVFLAHLLCIDSGSTAETVMDIIQEDLFPLPIRRTEDNFKPWMARAKGISTLVRHGAQPLIL